MILGGSGSYDSWGKWFPKPVSNQMAVVARYKKSSDGGHPEGHRKEWSNREYEDIFRNGMTWGAKLEHVEVVFNLLGGINQGCGLLLARILKKRQSKALVNTPEKIEYSFSTISTVILAPFEAFNLKN